MRKKIVAGIIVEYNPFHNGHIHHINEAKRLTNCDVLICVMSGNFVQRGEVALIDKSIRATCAVNHGVDIVLELPFSFATQSASYFAKASVEILALAKVDYIVFGSESNDLNLLIDLSNKLNIELNKNVSPITSYTKALGNISPNDILAINYIRYMKKYNIQPISIKRTNDYHATNLHKSMITSATSIRNNVNNSNKYTPLSLEDYELNYNRNYYSFIRLLLTQDVSYLKSLFMMDEGIENLFIKNISKYDNYDDFLESCVSKKYTKSRINRTLIHLLNSTTKKCINELPIIDFIRVLSFNNIGRSYLKTLKDINVVSKLAQLPSPFKEIEIKSNIIYNLNKTNKIKETIYPIYIKK